MDNNQISAIKVTKRQLGVINHQVPNLLVHSFQRQYNNICKYELRNYLDIVIKTTNKTFTNCFSCMLFF